MDFLVSPFEPPFVQRGVVEVLLLSVGAGLLGTWVVLRGLAFYSHAVGTATFPGLVLADGLGFAAPVGAFGAALVFAVVLGLLGRRGDGYDSSTALALAGALALGVILASDVFHSDASVESLLFGSLLLVEPRDLVIAAGASALALLATATFGRAWLASGFDRSSAGVLGLRSAVPDQLLLILIGLVVIASVSAVGALLVTALIVTPAATVRIWSSRLASWRVGTILLTALEGTAGLWLSVKTNAPPGATIAVLAAGGFALSAVTRAVLPALPTKSAAGAAAVLLAVTLAACGSESGSGGGAGDRVEVVATTTQIGDWVRQVGGDAVDVHQVLKPNTDPHEYELRPADVQAAAGADLVFKNGYDLDSWASELVEESGGDPEVVDLGSVVPQKLTARNGEPDPHWWHDPRNASSAVTAIRAALARARPEHRKTFRINARSYRTRLGLVDHLTEACIDCATAHRAKVRNRS